MEPVANKKLDGIVVHVKIVEAFLAIDFQLLRYGYLCNLDLSIKGERFEYDLVGKTSYELRPEGAGDLAKHGAFEANEWQARGTAEILGAYVACANDIETGEIICLMIGEGDSGVADHLQEEIPNEVMGLLDFIEKEDALAMLGKNRAEAARLAGLVSDKELYLVKVQKLAHIEAIEEFLAKNELGNVFGELGLSDASRTEEEDAGFWLIGGMQARALRVLRPSTYGRSRGPGREYACADSREGR